MRGRGMEKENPEALLDVLSMETFRQRFGLSEQNEEDFQENGNFKFPEEPDQLEELVRDLCIDDSISSCFAELDSNLDVENILDDTAWCISDKRDSSRRGYSPSQSNQDVQKLSNNSKGKASLQAGLSKSSERQPSSVCSNSLPDSANNAMTCSTTRSQQSTCTDDTVINKLFETMDPSWGHNVKVETPNPWIAPEISLAEARLDLFPVSSSVTKKNHGSTADEGDSAMVKSEQCVIVNKNTESDKDDGLNGFENVSCSLGTRGDNDQPKTSVFRRMALKAGFGLGKKKAEQQRSEKRLPSTIKDNPTTYPPLAPDVVSAVTRDSVDNSASQPPIKVNHVITNCDQFVKDVYYIGDIDFIREAKRESSDASSLLDTTKPEQNSALSLKRPTYSGSSMNEEVNIQYCDVTGCQSVSESTFSPGNNHIYGNDNTLHDGAKKVSGHSSKVRKGVNPKPWYENNIENDRLAFPSDRYRNNKMTLKDVIEESARVITPESDVSICDFADDSGMIVKSLVTSKPKLDVEQAEVTDGNQSRMISQSNTPGKSSPSQLKKKYGDFGRDGFASEKIPFIVREEEENDGICCQPCCCEDSRVSCGEVCHIYANEVQTNNAENRPLSVGIKLNSNDSTGKTNSLVDIGLNDSDKIGLPLENDLVMALFREYISRDDRAALLKLALDDAILEQIDWGQGKTTPMHTSIEMGKPACLQILLESRALVKRCGWTDEFGLKLAALAVKTNQVKCLILLHDVTGLKAMCGPLDPDGNTLMHLAASLNQTDVIVALLSLGHDVTLENKSGLSSLQLCLQHSASSRANGIGNESGGLQPAYTKTDDVKETIFHLDEDCNTRPESDLHPHSNCRKTKEHLFTRFTVDHTPRRGHADEAEHTITRTAASDLTLCEKNLVTQAKNYDPLRLTYTNDTSPLSGVAENTCRGLASTDGAQPRPADSLIKDTNDQIGQVEPKVIWDPATRGHDPCPVSCDTRSLVDLSSCPSSSEKVPGIGAHVKTKTTTCFVEAEINHQPQRQNYDNRKLNANKSEWPHVFVDPHIKNGHNFCISSDELYNKCSSDIISSGATVNNAMISSGRTFNDGVRNRETTNDSRKLMPSVQSERTSQAHTSNAQKEEGGPHVKQKTRHMHPTNPAPSYPSCSKRHKTEKMLPVAQDSPSGTIRHDRREVHAAHCSTNEPGTEKVVPRRKRRWRGISLLPHHLKKKIEQLSQRGRKMEAAVTEADGCGRRCRMSRSSNSSNSSSSNGSRSSSVLNVSSNNVGSRRHPKTTIDFKSRANAVVEFQDGYDDDRNLDLFSDHSNNADTSEEGAVNAAISPLNFDQGIVVSDWWLARHGCEKYQSEHSAGKKMANERLENGRHEVEIEQGDFWTSDDDSFSSITALSEESASDVIYSSMSDIGYDDGRNSGSECYDSRYYDQSRHNRLNQHQHYQHSCRDNHLVQNESDQHHDHHHHHHYRHQHRLHRDIRPKNPSRRMRTWLSYASDDSSSAVEYDDDESDEDEDSDMSDDPRVQVNVANEEWPEEMLRVERLAKHLDSVQRLQAGNSHVIETVITCAGEVLTSHDDGSREPNHVNIGEAYPFSTHQMQSVKCGRTTLSAKSTTSPNGLVGRKAKIHLFNHEKLSPTDKDEEITAADGAANRDVISQKCREMDRDVPWELLTFSDSDDADIGDRRNSRR